MSKQKSPQKKSMNPVVKGEPLPAKLSKHEIWVPIRPAIALLKVGLLGSTQNERDRYHLQGMFLRVSKRKLSTLSTDGHVLFNHEVELREEWAHPGDLAIWIPNADARRVVRDLVEIEQGHRFYSGLLEGSVVRTPATFVDEKIVSPECTEHPPFVVFDAKAYTYRHELGTMKMRDAFSDERKVLVGKISRTLESAKQSHHAELGKKPARHVALDARYLARAHRAVRIATRDASDGVVIHMGPSPTTPVLLQPTDYGDGEIRLDMVIMPIALRGTVATDFVPNEEILRPGRRVDAGPTDER